MVGYVYNIEKKVIAMLFGDTGKAITQIFASEYQGDGHCITYDPDFGTETGLKRDLCFDIIVCHQARH